MLILKLIQFLTVLVGSPKSFDGVADALCNIIFGQLGVVLTWTSSSTSGGQEETMVDVREHYYKTYPRPSAIPLEVVFHQGFSQSGHGKL